MPDRLANWFETWIAGLYILLKYVEAFVSIAVFCNNTVDNYIITGVIFEDSKEAEGFP
jgi:hypothetical protein